MTERRPRTVVVDVPCHWRWIALARETSGVDSPIGLLNEAGSLVGVVQLDGSWFMFGSDAKGVTGGKRALLAAALAPVPVPVGLLV